MISNNFYPLIFLIIVLLVGIFIACLLSLGKLCDMYSCLSIIKKETKEIKEEIDDIIVEEEYEDYEDEDIHES